MNKRKLLNSELSKVITGLGHTEYLVIADSGLPIPHGIVHIDLALSPGVPSFIDTLKVITDELVIEQCIFAEEILDKSKILFNEANALLGNLPKSFVSHEELKKLSKSAKCIVRTGEASPYANIILVGGVNF